MVRIHRKRNQTGDRPGEKEWDRRWHTCNAAFATIKFIVWTCEFVCACFDLLPQYELKSKRIFPLALWSSYTLSLCLLLHILLKCFRQTKCLHMLTIFWKCDHCWSTFYAHSTHILYDQKDTFVVALTFDCNKHANSAITIDWTHFISICIQFHLEQCTKATRLKIIFSI